MKVIVDTNVILDVLLARKPFLNSASEIFAMAEQSTITAFLCATTVTTIDYILIQSVSKPLAKKALHQLLEIFEVALVNRPVIEEALQSRMTDCEDAVIGYAGTLVGADLVITRNAKDFKHSPIKALDPDEFLSVMKNFGR